MTFLYPRGHGYGATGTSLSNRTKCGVLVGDLKICSGLVWRILLGLERMLLRGCLWIAGSRLQWTVAGWIVIYVTTGRQKQE